VEGFRAYKDVGNAVSFKSAHVVARRIFAKISEVPEEDANMLRRNLDWFPSLRVYHHPTPPL
jgi:hypothetical protein